jgi:hypothetical protein
MTIVELFAVSSHKAAMLMAIKTEHRSTMLEDGKTVLASLSEHRIIVSAPSQHYAAMLGAGKAVQGSLPEHRKLATAVSLR